MKPAAKLLFIAATVALAAIAGWLHWFAEPPMSKAERIRVCILNIAAELKWSLAEHVVPDGYEQEDLPRVVGFYMSRKTLSDGRAQFMDCAHEVTLARLKYSPGFVLLSPNGDARFGEVLQDIRRADDRNAVEKALGPVLSRALVLPYMNRKESTARIVPGDGILAYWYEPSRRVGESR